MFHYNARQLTFVVFPSSLAGPRQVSEMSITNKTEGSLTQLTFCHKRRMPRRKTCLKKGRRGKPLLAHTQYILLENNHLRKKPKVYRSNKVSTGLHLKFGQLVILPGWIFLHLPL